jgi:hypothetical protein
MAQNGRSKCNRSHRKWNGKKEDQEEEEEKTIVPPLIISQ